MTWLSRRVIVLNWLIESMDGSVHVERTRPFLEVDIPCFVDKPFACSTADAKAMIDQAAKKKVMIWSSSSLRFAPEIVTYVADERHGPVHGCVAHGPGTEHDRNPGMFHYGTHTAEILYTVMGPGCDRVTCTFEKGVTVAAGHWKDGRVATARCFRGGKPEYGLTASAEQGVAHVPLGVTGIFRELLKKVIASFVAGKPALDPLVTLEMVAFMEAANTSGANHFAPVAIKL
jgi:predicted dehydrogenase